MQEDVPCRTCARPPSSPFFLPFFSPSTPSRKHRCSQQPQLQQEVDQIAAQHHGQVAVYAKDLKTGQTVALKADEPVQTASVIKLALLYEAMEQIRARQAALGR